jgi:pimeloyl-ACP methyl ester carboxylesterase
LRSPSTRLDPAWRHHAPPSWQTGWDPAPFALEEGETEVVVMGSGPPLILLPPLPGWKEAWLACALRLARSFRLVTFDLRTRGHSGAPGARAAGEAAGGGRRGSGWDRLLDDLERVADAFAPGRAAVVGHSLGGALAQRWALARPERTAALVLSSTFARMSTPRGDRWRRFVEQPLVLASQRWLPEPLALRVARWLAVRGAWVYDSGCDAELLRFVRFAIRTVPLGLAAQRVRLAYEHDLRAELAAVACPTLVVRGERESRFVHQAAEELARLIPGAELRVSPGAGHLHPLSNASWLCESLEEWLRVTRSRGA